jgi:hypothetical protein
VEFDPKNMKYIDIYCGWIKSDDGYINPLFVSSITSYNGMVLVYINEHGYLVYVNSVDKDLMKLASQELIEYIRWYTTNGNII